METVTNQYLGGDTSLVCSAETQAGMDQPDVVELVKKQHQKAREDPARKTEKSWINSPASSTIKRRSPERNS